ncbi:hypothetical protein KC867_03755, partial [Candidatus Saccharibacteria bacterium]|nr:hypothetical protein [Candidatus Saccharibacteria bacterium]
MDNLLLHPKTRASLANVATAQHQAIALVGKPGSNKYQIARQLAKNLLQIDSLEHYPYYLEILPDDIKVSVEQIRDIHQFIKLRVPTESKSGINRVLLIYKAHKMTSSAQNALLKTLEEPPSGTTIILTTPSRNQLLKTVISRSQTIDILPVDKASATAFYATHATIDNLDSLYAMSQGQTGLLDSLVTNQDHPLIDKITTAKSLFTANKAERLIMVDELSKDREKAQSLLDAMLRITHASIVINSRKNDKSALSKW